MEESSAVSIKEIVKRNGIDFIEEINRLENEILNITEIKNLNFHALNQLQLLKNLGKEHVIKMKSNEVNSWVLFNRSALDLFLSSGDCSVSNDDNLSKEDRWFNALRILTNLTSLSSLIYEENSLEQKLAVAVALTFSSPLGTLADDFKTLINPTTRFSNFLKWTKEGALFASFSSLSAWAMRYVVGSWASDEELKWVRGDGIIPSEFRVRNKIGEAVHSIMKYRLINDKGISIHTGAEFYDFKPRTLEVLKIYGGVCGAISKFGSAVSQAFGVPAMPIAQPGHCAFMWLNEKNNWILSNDVSGIKSSFRHSPVQITWGNQAWLVSMMNSAQSNYENFSKAERLLFLSKLIQDQKLKIKLLQEGSSLSPYHYECLINQFNYFKALNLLLHNELLSKNKKCYVSDCEERASNLVDCTDSEWWSSLNNAWIKIDLENSSMIDHIKLRWWGISESNSFLLKGSIDGENYTELATNENVIIETKDDDYNRWITIRSERFKFSKIRYLLLELKNGCMDPWGMNKLFGIRRFDVYGKFDSQTLSNNEIVSNYFLENENSSEETELLSNYKKCYVSDCEERASNLVDCTDSEWWSSLNNAWIKIDLENSSMIDHIKLRWWGISESNSFLLKGSIDGENYTELATNENVIIETKDDDYNRWITIRSERFKFSKIRYLLLELKNGCMDPWGMNKLFGIRRFDVYGKFDNQTLSNYKIMRNSLLKKFKNDKSSELMCLFHHLNEMFDSK